MKFSARNLLEVEITSIDLCVANCQVNAKFNDIALCAIITQNSCESLGLKSGDKVNFLFKAQNIIVAKGQINAKLSLQNVIKAKIDSIKNGAVMAEIMLSFASMQFCAIITNKSVENLELKVGDEVELLINANDIIVAK